MTDMTADEASGKTGKQKKLLPALVVLAALMGGGAIGYLGIWSPLSLVESSKEPAPAPPVAATFLNLPRIVVSLPATPPRSVALTTMIEVAPDQLATAEQLQPRLLDSFTSFLSEIEPAAFDRRGILEIVRAELATRARFVLGDSAVKDILITEYRLQ